MQSFAHPLHLSILVQGIFGLKASQTLAYFAFLLYF